MSSSTSTAGSPQSLQRPDYERTPDADLLARIGDGDPLALAEVYRRHARLLLRVSLRVLRDHALAEDAVQDTFLTLWETARRYRPDRSAACTWLVTLAHRRAVDLVRREERRRKSPVRAGQDHSETSAHDVAALRQTRQRVQTALADLPGKQRIVLEASYYGGLTQSEVAARLAVPLGTVKSRTVTGLAGLRQVLDPA